MNYNKKKSVKNSQNSNKTFIPNMQNFSNNAEMNADFNNENIRKTVQEPKSKHDMELKTLINDMKKTMEMGSKLQSRLQSQVNLNKSKSIGLGNNMDLNNNFQNSKVSNPDFLNQNNNDGINDFGINMNINNNSIHMSNNNPMNFNNNILNMNQGDNNPNMDPNKIFNNNIPGNNNFMNMNNSNIMMNNMNMIMNNSNIMMNNNMNMNMNNSNLMMNNNMNMNMNNNNLMNLNQQDILNPMINQFNSNDMGNMDLNLNINQMNQFNEINNQISNQSKIKDTNNTKIFDKANIFNQNNFASNQIPGSTMINSEEKMPNLNPLNANSKSSKYKQDMNDKELKTQISYRHSVELSKYYDYAEDEKETHINKLLEDINKFGEITKKEIEKQNEQNPYYYMSIEEAYEKGNTGTNLEGFKNAYFALSILASALKAQGCNAVIERNNPQNSEEQNEAYTAIQFLVNGMYNFRKYIFHFDFDEKKSDELINNRKSQKIFNAQLKRKLLHLFKLSNNDIIMTNPKRGSYKITAIIKKARFNELSTQQIKQELLKDAEFKKIKEIEKSILLSGCKLNPSMLDSRGNNKDGGWGINEKRGGFDYYYPQGWIGYGLNVLDRFDDGDNIWLDYNNYDGEWAVAYHGVGSLLGQNEILDVIHEISENNLKSGLRQEYKDSNDFFHPGEKVGVGVYLSFKPTVIDGYCGVVNCGGKRYKLAFMTRVRPDRIRCPENKKDYWVINGTDNEVRPYRILIKEV